MLNIVEQTASAASDIVGAGLRPARGFSALPDIVRVFKTFSARQFNRQRKKTNEPIWQRNYYEHVIRDGRELDRIRQYISDNPARWLWDRENPAAEKVDDFMEWEKKSS